MEDRPKISLLYRMIPLCVTKDFVSLRRAWLDGTPISGPVSKTLLHHSVIWESLLMLKWDVVLVRLLRLLSSWRRRHAHPHSTSVRRLEARPNRSLAHGLHDVEGDEFLQLIIHFFAKVERNPVWWLSNKLNIGAQVNFRFVIVQLADAVKDLGVVCNQTLYVLICSNWHMVNTYVVGCCVESQ